MDGIEGKVVAITGASRGIGEATALLLAGRGAKLVLGARGAEQLDALVERITEAGGEAVGVPTDVRRAEDLEVLVARAQAEFGRLDVLFANAGVMPVSPLAELRTDEWRAMVDVNLMGVLNGIAAALPVFLAQGGGQFVTTASTAGMKVVPGQAVYAATKHAVRALCDGLRQEAGPDVRVNLISPGFTATSFADGVSDPVARAELEARAAAIAMPPEAVARAVAYVIEQPAGVNVGEVVIRSAAQA